MYGQEGYFCIGVYPEAGCLDQSFPYSLSAIYVFIFSFLFFSSKTWVKNSGCSFFGDLSILVAVDILVSLIKLCAHHFLCVSPCSIMVTVTSLDDVALRPTYLPSEESEK